MACSVMSLRQGSPDSFKAYVLDGQLFSLKFQAAGTNKNRWKKKKKSSRLLLGLAVRNTFIESGKQRHNRSTFVLLLVTSAGKCHQHCVISMDCL